MVRIIWHSNRPKRRLFLTQDRNDTVVPVISSETSALWQDRYRVSKNGLADLVLHGLETPVIIVSCKSSVA